MKSCFEQQRCRENPSKICCEGLQRSNYSGPRTESNDYYRLSPTYTPEQEVPSTQTVRLNTRKTLGRIKDNNIGVPSHGAIHIPGRLSRDQPDVYANLVSGCVVRCLFIILLTQAAFLTAAAAAAAAVAASETTVTNNFPSGCMFLYSSHQDTAKVLQDERLANAWSRLWDDQDNKLIRTYSCKNLALSTVPKGLASTSEALFLTHNSIEEVTRSDLTPDGDDGAVTSPIVALSLASNKISSIGKDTFQYMNEIKLLILRNNSIKNLQWTLPDSTILRNLTEMDLSLNRIEHFGTKDFGMFPVLKRLDLSGNKIRIVDGNALTDFPKLEHLDLSSNYIIQTSLTPCDDLIFTLKYLSLSDNLLGDLGTSHTVEFFSKLPNLREIDLSLNHITSGEVPTEAFAGLYSVRTLNLSSCGIKALKRGWLNGGTGEGLEVLDLSHNFLSTISADDLSVERNVVGNSTTSTRCPSKKDKNGPLENIEVLHLNGNYQLLSIQDCAFDHLPRLRLLFLQNCGIRRLNIASADNRFGVVDPIASTLPALTNVWIYGNPIACDCFVRFLKEWAVSTVTLQGNQTASKRYIDAPYYNIHSEVKTVAVDLAMCFVPDSLAGVTVEAAPGRSMTCQDEPYSIVIAMLIGPLTFAGSILLTVVCGSLHVSIARMKKNAVLSYHAREELLRNPKPRKRRRKPPPPIFSGFGWSHSHDDLSNYSTGSRGGRYTNLVLGQFGEHHQQKEAARAHRRLSPEMALAASTASLNIDDHHLQSRAHSAGYCSGTENFRPEHHQAAAPVVIVSDTERDTKRREGGSASDTDSVLGRESVRTRSPSNDIPFIDEKDQGEPERRSTGRLSSSSGSNGSLLDVPATSDGTFSGSEIRLRKDSSRLSSNGGHNSERSIPGLSTMGHSSTDETTL